MAKGVQRVKDKTKSRKDVVAGDKYQIATDITVADVDGDGFSDLTFAHKVDKNGQNWVDAQVVWYGLTPEITLAFIDILKKVGFVDDDVVETNRLNVVMKHWKELTRALGQVNKLGDQLVVSIGEKVED
jgi:hypothetical protein